MSIQNPWKPTFHDVKGFTPQEIARAEELVSRGLTLSNEDKGVSATYGELQNGSFKWGQVRVAYKKSMVSIPYFIGDDGKTYILVSENYQPIPDDIFEESARGFAIVVDGKLESTSQTALRIIRQKTNLPLSEFQIFRLAGPINPDPSWFNVCYGLSFVGCKLPDSYFKRDKDDKYVVDEECVIDVKKSTPKIIELDTYLNQFETSIESDKAPICGLTLQAAALLWYHLHK